jgi:hypothetical protein
MVRAHRRTRSPSLRAMTRWRSNLISCSQPGPDGGLSASPGCRRRIKPRGLATRAHRPRRTPQHAGDIAAGAAERESCPLSADTVEKHIVLVFSESRIRPEWRDVRDHVWSGLSNVGALQRTCAYIRRSLLGEDFERRSTLEFFNNIRPLLPSPTRKVLRKRTFVHGLVPDHQRLSLATDAHLFRVGLIGASNRTNICKTDKRPLPRRQALETVGLGTCGPRSLRGSLR